MIRIVFFVFVACCAFFTRSNVQAELTSPQKRDLALVKSLIDKSASFFLAQQFEQSGQEIRKAQEAVEGITEVGKAEMLEQLKPSYARLTRAHQLLTSKGISLPKLQPLAPPAKKPSSNRTADRNQVSFVKHVAPILVGRCGRCHVEKARGELSMASFTAMMRGSENGAIVSPGQPEKSSLIEVLVSGDMPPRGGRLPAKELKTLQTWVAQGAKFDGPNKQTRLTEMAGRGGARSGFGRGRGR